MTLQRSTQLGIPATCLSIVLALGSSAELCAQTMIIQPSPTTGSVDLAPRTTQMPTSVRPGETVQVSLAVRNNGKAASRGGWVARVYASRDETVNANDMLIGSYTFPNQISAGLIATTSGAVVIPAALIPAQWHVGILVDATGIVAESDESNNYSIPLAITVLPIADLVVSTVTGLPATLSASNTIIVTPSNSGAGTIAGGWQGRIYLSIDAQISSADNLVGTFTYGSSIASGSNGSPVSASFAVPSTVPGGSYYAGVIVDATNVITEVSESNNVHVAGLTRINRAPLLEVTSITLPPRAASGQNGADRIDVSFFVRNRGDAAANGSSTKFWLSSDDDLVPNVLRPQDDVELGIVSDTRTIVPGDGIQVTGRLSLPHGKAPGTYYLGVRQLPLNAETSAIELFAPPDLRAVAVNVPTAVPGQTLPVSLLVENVGAGVARAGWSASFSSPFGSVKSAVSSELAAGQRLEVPATISIPSTASPGTSTLRATVNDGSTIYEEIISGGAGGNNAEATIRIPASVGIQLDSLRIIREANGGRTVGAWLRATGKHDATGSGWASTWVLEVFYAADSATAAAASATTVMNGLLLLERHDISDRARGTSNIEVTVSGLLPPDNAAWMSARVRVLTSNNIVAVPAEPIRYSIRVPEP